MRIILLACISARLKRGNQETPVCKEIVKKCAHCCSGMTASQRKVLEFTCGVKSMLGLGTGGLVSGP